MKRLMLVLSMVVLLVGGCCGVAYPEELRTGLIDTSDPREALKIKTISWVADGWFLAKWKILVENNSTSDWKDILFKGVYFGESGTAIKNSVFDYTRYVVIRSGSTVLVILDGVRCPKQAVAGGANIVKATLCEYNLCE